MVQYIPSPAGTTPYPQNNRIGQIFEILKAFGNMMGGVDERGNKTGIASIKQAMDMKQPLSQYLHMPQQVPDRPVTMGPMGPVNLSQTARGMPGAAPMPNVTGNAPNPLGVWAGVPADKFHDMMNMVGKTGVSSILGAQQSMYMDPNTGSVSYTPGPGLVPIGGMKPPQAYNAVATGKRLELARMHNELMTKLGDSKIESSLTPEEKMTIALAKISSQALSNPMADFSDQDQEVMRQNVIRANEILSRKSGVATGDDAHNVIAITTKAEYDKLKPGTKFSWNGQVTTKGAKAK